MVYTDKIQKKADNINHLDALFQDWFESLSKLMDSETINRLYPNVEELRKGFLSNLESWILINNHEITHLDGTCSGQEISKHGCDSRVDICSDKPMCEALDELCPFTFRVGHGQVCGFAKAIMEVIP